MSMVETKTFCVIGRTRGIRFTSTCHVDVNRILRKVSLRSPTNPEQELHGIKTN